MWVMIVDGTGIAQQARSTADANATANATLPSPPTGPVFSIVQYGGTSGSGGQSIGSPPSGWSAIAHFGSQAPYGKYVQIFQGSTQGISYNLGSNAVSSGGRDIILLEITP